MSFGGNFELYYINEKYVNLDMAYLVDLCEIGQELRVILNKMLLLGYVNTISNPLDEFNIVNKYPNKEFNGKKILHKKIWERRKRTFGHKLNDFLNECLVSKEFKRRKLRNHRIKQITSTIFLLNEIVCNKRYVRKVYNELYKFLTTRVLKHKDYYINNNLLVSTDMYFFQILSYLLKKIKLMKIA